MGVVIAAGVAGAQVTRPNLAKSSYLCNLARVPTAWAFDNPPGSIDENNAMFTPTGWDTVHLKFRSAQATPIKTLKLVVEYVDAEGEPIARVPMYAYVDPSTEHMPSNVLRPDNTWGTPVTEGNSGEMNGQEVSIRTGRCPVQARVTFASIGYTDSSVRTYSSPEWRLDPTPSLVPMLRDVPNLPLQPPLSLLAKLRIGASGDVLDVIPGVSADARLAGWVRDVMMNNEWKFHPAILNGQPIESELDVLFEIHTRESANFADDHPILKPVTLIRFLWTHDSTSRSGKATMMYGVLTEGSAPARYGF